VAGLLIPASRLDAQALNAMIRRNERRLASCFPGLLRAGESLGATRAHLDLHRACERSGRSWLSGISAPDGDLAGLLFLNSINPDTGVAEAAGVLDADHEGRGLMRGAMREVFDLARERLGLARVRFLIAPDNARSLAMAEALGFRREDRPPRRFAAGASREVLMNYYLLKLRS